MEVKMTVDTREIDRMFKVFPKALDRELYLAVDRTQKEVVKKARILAPVDTGQLRREIRGFTYRDSMAAMVYAHDDTHESKVKAHVLEYGRKAGERGKMVGEFFMYYARVAVSVRFRNRVKRALSKAVKEAAST